MSSNLYAEKIYSANPTILWALDDTFSGTPVDISSSINTVGYGIPAYAYGRSDKYGYYLGKDSTLANITSINDGIPMVYGATNVTTIYENKQSSVNYPSVIFPGFGFLNNSGKYKSYTLEMWLRINSESHYPRKIVGPIASEDGLYVDGPFLKLKINDTIGSHYVGEWGRPMIVHITYTESSASLIVNGDPVFSLNFDPTRINFANFSGTNSKQQDWIGIYAYDNITPVQVDCIALYPYVLANRDAKLHFVWGQAVESPELKNSGYSDSPVIIDYQMSKSANSYVYPGTGRWKNGIYNNISVDDNRIYTPTYQLPTLVFKDQDKQLVDWLGRQELIQTATSSLSDGSIIDNDTYFRMDPRPTGLEWYSNGYINFPKFNVLPDAVNSVYGVFELNSFLDDSGNTSAEQTLFRILDNNSNYLESVVRFANATSATVYYKYYSPVVANQAEYTGQSVTVDTKFSVGIDITALSSINENIKIFFSNRQALSLQLAGKSDFTGMFTGRVYKFGFSNAQNFAKISSEFSNGIAKTTSVTALNTFIASYTLFGLNTMGTFSLDIATNGTWQDYIPLRLLSKNVVSSSTGATTYKLNFMQFNLDYPELANVSNGIVKTTVAFKDIKTFVPENLQSSRTLVNSSTSNVLEPSTDWASKKYLINTNTVIYPPTGSTISDLGLITLIEFSIPGIIRNPVQIRNMHISSQALDYTTVKTPIGSKYARDIYSYALSDGAKKYDGKNPFTIYKNSTPYLYLNKYSGIKLAGSSIDGTHGIEIPINKFGASYYKVGFIQVSALSSQSFSSSSETELYRVSGGNLGSTYTLVAKGISGNTNSAYVYIKKDGTILYDADITIYINGVKKTYTSGTKTTIIRKNEWAMIGVAFVEPLNFNNSKTGTIDITGPIMLNNIADYQIIESDEKNVQLVYAWNHWYTGTESWSTISSGKTWQNLLFQTTSNTKVVVDGEQVYRSYIGSNRLQINSTPEYFALSSYKYSVLANISSSTRFITPL